MNDILFGNNNKAVVKKLAKRSVSASRTRSIVTVIAIAITALLFTSVVTLAAGTIQSTQLSLQMMKGSKADATLQYLSEEQFEQLQQHAGIKKAGLRMPVGFLANTKQHNIELNVMDETQMELTFATPTHGTIPKKSDELVTSDIALRELGAEPAVGQQVTLEIPIRGQVHSVSMKVSGWYEAHDASLSVMVVSPEFAKAHEEWFQNTFAQDKELVGTYFSDIEAKKTAGLKQQLEEFVASVGGSNDRESAQYIGLSVNNISNPALDVTTIGAVAAAILLFTFCGYLLIYNIFDIAVMQDIRRYGLYRTVGMSKRQMKKIINRQAALLSAIGIPIGLALGYFVGWAALPAITNMFSFEMRGFSVAKVSPNPLIFIAGALFAGFTVYLSTRKPIRKVSAIAPIEALRFVGRDSTKKRTKKRSKVSIGRMAWQNLGRSKRRSVFIVISLMLCIVLLNTAAGLAESVDIDRYMAEFVRTDFTVASADAFNRSVSFTRQANGLSQQAIDEISAQPWLQNGSVIYKNTLDDSFITYDWGAEFERIVPTWLDVPDVYDGIRAHTSVRLGADQYPLGNVVGMDKAALSRLILWEGETDLDTLWEKLQNGEGLLIGEGKERAEMAPSGDINAPEVGDEITIRVNGEPQKSLPVLAKALYIMPAIDVTNNDGCSKVGGDTPAIFLPTEQFLELYKTPSILKYEFDVDEGVYEQANEFLAAYIQQNKNVNFSSSQQQRATGESMQNMILLVGGLLALVFAFAGVLNLINVLISNILARRQEFATLQSVGMTRGQLRGMVVLESLYYALLASGFGLLLSVLVSKGVLKTVCGTFWFMSHKFVLLPAVIACVVMAVLAAVVTPVLLKAFQKGSIVERLRESE